MLCIPRIGEERRYGLMCDVFIKISHDDDLFMVELALDDKFLEVEKYLCAWTCGVMFEKEEAAMLLIYAVVAIGVGFTRAVYLDDS